MRRVWRVRRIAAVAALGATLVGCRGSNGADADQQQSEDWQMNGTNTEFAGLLLRFEEADDVDAGIQALSSIEATTAPPQASASEQEGLRDSKLLMLLAFLNVIDAKIDPAFDSEDLPLMTVAPPPETGLPAGVDPASIDDLELRSRYLESLAANRRKAAEHRYQSKLRQLESEVLEAVEHHLESEYGPDKREALGALIDERIKSDERKASLQELVDEIMLGVR